MNTVSESHSNILKLIKIHEEQKRIAKQNYEYNVVAYHQKEINTLYNKLKSN